MFSKKGEVYNRIKRILVVYVIFKLLVIGGVIYSYYYTYHHPHVKTEKIIIIPKHSSISKIAEQLKQEEIIKSKFLFILISKALTYKHEYLKPGEYKFSTGMKLKDIITKLIKEDVIIHKITIPEGLTNSQVFKLLDNTYGLSGNIDKINYKEGYLLPETYAYRYGDSKESIANRMQSGMEKQLKALILSGPLPVPLKNINELITLASIVEKESGVEAERARIAGVYLNRLRVNMPLQADPTVVYAMTLGEEPFSKRLTYKDLEIDSPYNTYKYKGLPPAPIANPGLKSVIASLYPMATNDLFFVATGDGGHNFSENYKGHLANVKSFREITNKKLELK